MQKNTDNENLRLMYALGGGQPYDPRKWHTCSNNFVASYPTFDHQFKLDGQFKQINVRFVFK